MSDERMDDATVLAYCEAMGDWDALDPRIFAPAAGGEFEPMSEQLSQALLVAAVLEAGDAGVSFDDIGHIMEDVREHLKALSVLRGVLTGGCGISWDGEKGRLMLRLVDTPEECARRREAIAAVLRFPKVPA